MFRLGRLQPGIPDPENGYGDETRGMSSSSNDSSGSTVQKEAQVTDASSGSAPQANQKTTGQVVAAKPACDNTGSDMNIQWVNDGLQDRGQNGVYLGASLVPASEKAKECEYFVYRLDVTATDAAGNIVIADKDVETLYVLDQPRNTHAFVDNSSRMYVSLLNSDTIQDEGPKGNFLRSKYYIDETSDTLTITWTIKGYKDAEPGALKGFVTGKSYGQYATDFWQDETSAEHRKSFVRGDVPAVWNVPAAFTQSYTITIKPDSRPGTPGRVAVAAPAILPGPDRVKNKIYPPGYNHEQHAE